MKYIKYLFVGILFGITLTKSEVISWYRIHEMFRFESFHMYGIIGSAVILGVITIYLIKKLKLTSMEGKEIFLPPKQSGIIRYLAGGTIFGLGWAMTGACPGPMYALLGNGFLMIGIVILSALTGTFIYGSIKNKLPH